MASAAEHGEVGVLRDREGVVVPIEDRLHGLTVSARYEPEPGQSLESGAAWRTPKSHSMTADWFRASSRTGAPARC